MTPIAPDAPAVLLPTAPSRAAPALAGRKRLPGSQLLGWSLLLLVLAATLGAPLLTPHDPTQVSLAERLQPPSPAHPLGQDHLGRDLLARILYGGRTSLLTAAGVLAGAAGIGLPLGMLAGYLGGRTDRLVTALIDLVLALPSLVLVLFVAGALGPTLLHTGLAIVAVRWAPYARMARAAVLPERERDYVVAGQAAGAGPIRLLCTHIAPNIVGPLVVWVTLDVGRIILTVAGLSFLGLGAQPPVPEWGAMLASSRSFFQLAPQLLFYPGLTIAVTVLACNLIGDGLRDRLDPRSRAI